MKRISFIDDIILPAAQAVSEATWLYAAILGISAMSASVAQYAGFFSVLALLTGSAWITHLSRLIVRPLFSRFLLGCMVMILLTAWLFWTFCIGLNTGSGGCTDVVCRIWNSGRGIHDASVFFTWVMGFYLAGRGVWIGFSPPGVKTQARRLLVGTVVFVLLFAAWPNLHQAHPYLGQFRILASVYFLVGLILLAFVNVRKLGPFTAGRGSSTWLVAISIPTLLVIALGLIFTGGFSSALRWFFQATLQAINAAGGFMLWIGAWIMYFFAWLSSLLPKSGPRITPSFDDKPVFIRRSLLQDFRFEDLPGPVTTWSISVVVLILAAIAIVLFVFFRRRTGKDLLAPVSEERTSLWSCLLVWYQIRKFLLKIIKRLGYMAQTTLPFGRWSEKRDPESNLAEIRKIYQRFLEWSAARRQPRRPAQTPLELARELSTASSYAPLAILTQCYHDVRYGDVTAPPPDIEKARHALQQLEREDQAPANTAQPGEADRPILSKLS